MYIAGIVVVAGSASCSYLDLACWKILVDAAGCICFADSEQDW